MFTALLYRQLQQAACASFLPDKELVQTLLNADTDINAQGGVYGNALKAASYKGSENLVRRLLEAGANVNAHGGVYGSALQAACASCKPQESIVRMLLDAGAEVNAQGGKFDSVSLAVLSKIYTEGIQLELPDEYNIPFGYDEGIPDDRQGEDFSSSDESLPLITEN